MCVNLKYGIGLEMYNWRYETNITYHKNPAYIYRDTIQFSKNKLATDYVTIPFMININPFPHRRQGLSFSVGISAGYLYNSRNKQVSDERGKQKIHGDFDLDPARCICRRNWSRSCACIWKLQHKQSLPAWSSTVSLCSWFKI